MKPIMNKKGFVLVFLSLGTVAATAQARIKEVTYNNIDGNFRGTVHAVVGQTIILPCNFRVSASKERGLKRYWKFNMTEMANEEDVHDSRNDGIIMGESFYNIKLGSVQVDQIGRYCCTVAKINNNATIHQECWDLHVAPHSEIKYMKITGPTWVMGGSTVMLNCIIGGIKPRPELAWLKWTRTGWKQLYQIRKQLSHLNPTKVTATVTFKMMNQDERIMCMTLQKDGIKSKRISKVTDIKVMPAITTSSDPTSSVQETRGGFEVIDLSVDSYGYDHLVLTWRTLYHDITIDTINFTIYYRSIYDEELVEINGIMGFDTITKVKLTGLIPATTYVFYVVAQSTNSTSLPSAEIVGSTSSFPQKLSPPLSKDIETGEYDENELSSSNNKDDWKKEAKVTNLVELHYGKVNNDTTTRNNLEEEEMVTHQNASEIPKKDRTANDENASIRILPVMLVLIMGSIFVGMMCRFADSIREILLNQSFQRAFNPVTIRRREGRGGAVELILSMQRGDRAVTAGV